MKMVLGGEHCQRGYFISSLPICGSGSTERITEPRISKLAVTCMKRLQSMAVVLVGLPRLTVVKESYDVSSEYQCARFACSLYSTSALRALQQLAAWRPSLTLTFLSIVLWLTKMGVLRQTGD